MVERMARGAFLLLFLWQTVQCFVVAPLDNTRGSHFSKYNGKGLLPQAPARTFSSAPTYETQLSMSLWLGDATSDLPLTPLLLVVLALGIGVSAQTLINSQLDGDQGLGAFLRDGSGYSKSGFRPMSVSSDDDRAVEKDPLPWLQLPQLDFVDVAGQDNANNDDDKVFETLESLRLELNRQLERGNTSEAKLIQTKMETIMKENDIDYQTG